MSKKPIERDEDGGRSLKLLETHGDDGDDGDDSMEVSLTETLLNSISRFGSLSSSNSANTELIQRYYLKIGDILEPLKQIFEEFSFPELSLNEKLNNILKDLDAAIDEARELLDSCHQLMSKVYFVMEIESVIAKLQTYALEACQLLNSSLADYSTSTSVENCMQKIQQIHHEQMSNVIKEAIRAQVDKTVPRSEQLERISKSLSLSSNQELLMEAVALDKLKAKVGRSENHAEIGGVSQMIVLINYMHDCYVKIKQLDSINGVPIPADFCCPLSLELMSDPVIVASGQTCERAFIKQWLDQGFNVCPKTRQTLGNTNLIPNYTVKALIANWCESNDIKLPDPLKSMNLNLPPVFVSLPDSSANGSTISHSTQSPRGNHPRSPDFLIKDSTSSNGFHQDKKPTSPRRPTSLGSPMHIANGCEIDIARMSLVDSDVKKEASLEEQQVCSSSQTSNQSKQYISRGLVVDGQSQGHNRGVSASNNASNNGYLQGEGDENMVSRDSSDLSRYSSDASGEVAQDSPSVSAPSRERAFSPRLLEVRSRSQSSWRRPSERFVPRIISSPSTESRPDLSAVEAQARKLIEDLKSDSVDVQRVVTPVRIPVKVY